MKPDNQAALVQKYLEPFIASNTSPPVDDDLADGFGAEVELSTGQVAIVDEKWHPIISASAWTYNGHYAIRAVRVSKGESGRRTLMMHSVILPPKAGYFADHINGNKLDNRRANLRYATRTENGGNRPMQKNNTTGYKGVSFHIRKKKYGASIKHQQKQKNLGYFDTPEEASAAYNAAAEKHFNEFARLNAVPQPQPSPQSDTPAPQE